MKTDAGNTWNLRGGIIALLSALIVERDQLSVKGIIKTSSLEISKQSTIEWDNAFWFIKRDI